MPALLLRRLLQCAGDVKMNPGPFSTPTPDNCLRLMQWNACGISGKITELLTLLHANNINIVTIQEIKPQEQRRRPANANQRHDPLFRQHGRSSSVSRSSSGAKMHNHQQLHIYIPPRSSCSAGHNTLIAHLLSNNKDRLLSGMLILTHIPFHPAQHVFQPKHWICTALSTITTDISRKKRAHRTLLVALILTAAFNNVDHQQLLVRLFNTNIPSTIRRWLYIYLQNRRAKVHFRQQETKSRKVKPGVAQGGVLSQALFKGEARSGTRRSSVSSALQR